MTLLALGLACTAVLISLVTAAALVEANDALAILRDMNGLNDELQPVEMTDLLNTAPGHYGLPRFLNDGSWVILFLSPTCAACHHLAKGLKGNIPELLHVVVTNASAELARSWLSRYGLLADLCTIDDERTIADGMGIATSPLALVVQEGGFARAMVVPSGRALTALLDELTDADMKATS